MLQCDFGSPSPAPTTPHWTFVATPPVSAPLPPSLATPASTLVLSAATGARFNSPALVLATASTLASS